MKQVLTCAAFVGDTPRCVQEIRRSPRWNGAACFGLVNRAEAGRRNQWLQRTDMNDQFNELTKNLAHSVTRHGRLKRLSPSFVGVVLAVSLSFSAFAGKPDTTVVSVVDAANDAEFPYELFDGPVPSYLDVLEASVSGNREVFHFEIKVNSTIPDNADPGWTPSLNHLGLIVGISIDPKAVGPTKFFGQPDNYYFNFLVGAMYFAQDNGLGVGWKGFILGANGFQEIPLNIRKDRLIFEVSAESLGHPASFGWAVGSHCSPSPEIDETKRSTILVDYTPNHGLATWPAP